MSSVRVRSPDWAAVYAGLQAWASELIESDSSALGVLLYGSLARGDHAPGSDADLIVVVESSPHEPRQRAAHLAALRLPICHEVVVYTADEFRRLQEEGSFFVVRALAEGRWLARRRDWRP